MKSNLMSERKTVFIFEQLPVFVIKSYIAYFFGLFTKELYVILLSICLSSCCLFFSSAFLLRKYQAVVLNIADDKAFVKKRFFMRFFLSLSLLCLSVFSLLILI